MALRTIGKCHDRIVMRNKIWRIGGKNYDIMKVWRLGIM